MTVKKFRKKPVEIEAKQFKTKNDLGCLVKWIQSCNGNAYHDGVNLFILTLEGEMRADCGDWIILGVKGEFYPCKSDIFDVTYEEV